MQNFPGHYLFQSSLYVERTRSYAVLSDSTKCKYMHYSGYIEVVFGWSYKCEFYFYGFTLQSNISKSNVTFEFSGTVYYVNGDVWGLFPKTKWDGHLIIAFSPLWSWVMARSKH
jgi:hypothetical protein